MRNLLPNDEFQKLPFRVDVLAPVPNKIIARAIKQIFIRTKATGSQIHVRLLRAFCPLIRGNKYSVGADVS